MELKLRKLGLQDYHKTWASMQNVILSKGQGDSDELWLLEHFPVYTLGFGASENNLLIKNDIPVIRSDRGGEVTYHGPGQLVCYPILNLHNYQLSISWYMRNLENVIIQCLKDHGIEADQKHGLTGVWVRDEKICAMGVRLSRWVTMHGFALNLNPDMEYYDGMIPCGIFHYGITTLNQQGINVTIETLLDFVISSFDSLFDGEIDEV